MFMNNLIAEYSDLIDQHLFSGLAYDKAQRMAYATTKQKDDALRQIELEGKSLNSAQL